MSGLALCCRVVSLYLGDEFLGIHYANYNSHSSVIMSMSFVSYANHDSHDLSAWIRCSCVCFVECTVSRYVSLLGVCKIIAPVMSYSMYPSSIN